MNQSGFFLSRVGYRVPVAADWLTLGRLAVVIHATAGVIDPGYRGQITLELSNLGTAPVALTPGMRISQVIFTELKTPAEKPYGKDRGSKYQDQKGPQASKIQLDPEFRK